MRTATASSCRPWRWDYDEIMQINMEEYPSCFKYKPVAHFVYQCMVSNVDAKNVVQKGASATDDIVRALCTSLSHCLLDERVDMYGLYDEAEVVRPNYFIGTKVGKLVASSRVGVRGDGTQVARSSSFGVRA